MAQTSGGPPSLTVTGIADLVKKTSGDAVLRRPLAEMFRRLGITGEAHARRGAVEHKDTGALARSLASESKDLSARVFSTLAYAKPVEEGRRAGAQMPPPNALVGWMRRHGLDGVSPFVIARAIARRGIKGRFFMKRALEALRRDMPGLVDQAKDAIERAWTA